MPDLDLVCPKLDEALTMIKHGNTFRLQPHLHELSEQLIPLLEIIYKESPEVLFDIDAFRRTIAYMKENSLEK